MTLPETISPDYTLRPRELCCAGGKGAVGPLRMLILRFSAIRRLRPCPPTSHVLAKQAGTVEPTCPSGGGS